VRDSALSHENQCDRDGAKSAKEDAKKKQEPSISFVLLASYFALFAPSRLHL